MTARKAKGGAARKRGLSAFDAAKHIETMEQCGYGLTLVLGARSAQSRAIQTTLPDGPCSDASIREAGEAMATLNAAPDGDKKLAAELRRQGKVVHIPASLRPNAIARRAKRARKSVPIAELHALAAACPPGFDLFISRRGEVSFTSKRAGDRLVGLKPTAIYLEGGDDTKR